LRILVRTGDSVTLSDSSSKIVKMITSLAGSPGTLADGRWRVNYATTGRSVIQPEITEINEWIGARLTFTDGTEVIVVIPAYAINQAEWTFLAQTGSNDGIPGLEGDTITSFGLPAFGPDTFAVIANFALVTGSAFAVNHPAPLTSSNPVVLSSSNDFALITGTFEDTPGNFENTLTILARPGDPVPDDANGFPWPTSVSISGISDPVVGSFGSVAFMVKLAGLPSGLNTGIEYAPDGESPSLVAVATDAAPGGGFWASFSSLVLPQGNGLLINGVQPGVARADSASFDGGLGPIFVGKLILSASDGVTTANDVGLWGVDGFGDLILLLRTGQTVTLPNSDVKTIKSFIALAAAPGSVGAASGYDDEGNVAVLATFTDGTQALLNIAIPLDEP